MNIAVNILNHFLIQKLRISCMLQNFCCRLKAYAYSCVVLSLIGVCRRGKASVSLLSFSPIIKMLMFETEKWVMFDSACAKRDDSRSCIIRDGAWTRGV